MGSIFKAEGKTLAVRETDVKLYYDENNYLVRI